MSVYAVERVRQVMDCLIAEKISPIVAAGSLPEQALRCFGDVTSQDAFQKELIFLALRQIIGEMAAHNLAGDINVASWQAAIKQTEEALAKKAIPALNTPLTPDNTALTGLYASVFTLSAASFNDASPKEGDTMLDFGARFGETAVWALSRGVKQVYAFEADPAAFACLSKNAETFGGKKITPEQALPADKEGTLRFGEGKKHADVPAVKIDVWCEKNKVQPNFIRVNLAGAAPALVGAQEIIKTCKPRMAVNLSGNLADMWNIPLLLKQLAPEYRMACRKNAPDGDFMLYAAV